jgi:hypothetical protein
MGGGGACSSREGWWQALAYTTQKHNEVGGVK